MFQLFFKEVKELLKVKRAFKGKKVKG